MSEIDLDRCTPRDTAGRYSITKSTDRVSAAGEQLRVTLVQKINMIMHVTVKWHRENERRNRLSGSIEAHRQSLRERMRAAISERRVSLSLVRYLITWSKVEKSISQTITMVINLRSWYSQGAVRVL